MHLLKLRLGPFLVCFVVFAIGCAAWRQAAPANVFRFDHQLHLSLECVDCHTEVAKGATAGMPTLETCTDCHETIDEKKPPERHVARLFENGRYKAANVTAIPSEVIFSHQRHTTGERKLACTDCHQGIEQSTAITKDVRVDMKECMDCHERSKAPNECATCHQRIRKDVRPATHAKNWRRGHGQVAKDGDDEGLNECSLCHAEDSCTSCHQTEAPANHNEHWRQRGHGLAASTDRDACTTCHQSDSCESCHKTTAPRTHRGQWGAPTDRHCLDCHVPVADTSCAVCHDGTPSHATATPTPASMIATDCRSCHGVTLNALMPHVDNGDDCNYCHR